MHAPGANPDRAARWAESPAGRWLLPLLLAGWMVSLTAGCPARAPRPNIILIVVDTLRADYVGVYGFEGEVTPHLDDLARESILFRNCFTQSPWTKPAMASLFTSLHPQVHGLTNHEGKYWGEGTAAQRTGVLSDRAVTLAEQLKKSGYETAGYVTNPWLSKTYGFGKGFDVYHEEEAEGGANLDALMDNVETWFGRRDRSRPYFLYLHFMDVHAPYSGLQRDFKALRESPTVQSTRLLGPAEMPDKRWYNIEVRPPWATDEMRREVAYWRTRYATGIRAFDERFGGLLDYLRELGELDRSVLVFTSDHGEELFEHGDWSHGQNLFEHQLRIPLIIRNPQGRGGGVEVETFVDLIDLMPTLLTVAGAEPPDGMQGRDVSVILEGGVVEHPEITFATATQRLPGLYTARTARYKLLYDLPTEWERLFDLTGDGAELEDVGPREPQIADDLRDRLLTHISTSVAGGTLEAGSVAIPEELRERLRALGYVQ